MKFEREAAAGRNLFTGYGDGWVEVNGRRLGRGLLVNATQVIEDWGPGRFEDLAVAHFESVLAQGPEIVLLGTGSEFRFPDPAILAPLHAARIGVEVMDTRAACRTYNILLGEGRAVLAALLVEGR